MKCKYCDFDMDFEAWNIQKAVCIRCNNLIMKAKKEVFEDLNKEDLPNRLNLNCNAYEVASLYYRIIEKLKKKHLGK